MREQPTYPSVREVELSFLRKSWWLFPMLGVLASLVSGGPAWRWVAGADPFPLPWGQIFSLRSGGLALAFLAIPALWRMGLNADRLRCYIVPASLLFVILVEFLLRTTYAQGPFWLAARCRLEAEQWFMGEVCYVRLEEAAGRSTPDPSVVLMGSSQMLNGVDDHLLRELVHPMPVIRRSMFGMTPLKALSMMGYVPFRADDVCVQYLSEFDFTNQDDFPHDWFRPYASWRTLPDVLSCISPAVRVSHWRQLVDYALAATFECWRARDFLSQVVLHFWGASSAPAGKSLAAVPAIPAKEGVRYSMAEMRAFQRFARRLDERKVELLVFEGDVNPALYSPARLRAKAEVRQALAAFAGMKAYRYVPLAEQALALGPSDWRDMTHLNPVGRDRLTRRMAQELLPP